MISTDYLGVSLKQEFYDELNKTNGAKVTTEVELITDNGDVINLDGSTDFTIEDLIFQEEGLYEILEFGMIAESTNSIEWDNVLDDATEEELILFFGTTSYGGDLYKQYTRDHCSDWKTFTFYGSGIIQALISIDGENWQGIDGTSDYFLKDVVYDINWLPNSFDIYIKFIFLGSSQLTKIIITGKEYTIVNNRLSEGGERTIYQSIDKFAGSFSFADYSLELINTDDYFSKIKFDGSENTDSIFYDSVNSVFYDWSNWTIKVYFRYEKEDRTRTQKILLFSGNINRLTYSRHEPLAIIEAENTFKKYQNKKFNSVTNKPIFTINLYGLVTGYTTEEVEAKVIFGNQYKYEIEEIEPPWSGKLYSGTGSITAVQTTIDLFMMDKTLGVAPDYGWGENGVILIDDELITYTTFEGVGAELRLNGCTRGAFGTTATTHNSGAIIKRKRCFILYCDKNLPSDASGYSLYFKYETPVNDNEYYGYFTDPITNELLTDFFTIDSSRKLIVMDPQYNPETNPYNWSKEIKSYYADFILDEYESNPALVAKELFLDYLEIDSSIIDEDSFDLSATYLLAATLCYRFEYGTNILEALAGIALRSNLFFTLILNDKISCKFPIPRFDADSIVGSNNNFGEEFVEEIIKRYSPITVKYYDDTSKIDKDNIHDNGLIPSTEMEIDGSSDSEVIIVGNSWAEYIGNRLYEKLGNLKEYISNIEVSPDKGLLLTLLDVIKVGDNIYEMYENEITVAEFPQGCSLNSLYKIDRLDSFRWFILDHTIYGKLSDINGLIEGQPGNMLW